MLVFKIAYDECHMAKSFSKNGVIGKCVVRLQENLPKSRVIYASATALSSPENIEYLTRLGKISIYGIMIIFLFIILT